MKIGVDHGVGCDADKLPEDQRTRTVIPNQFRHEIATAFNLKARSLVVLTSCSHRSVVNAIKQAQATSGIKKVHAVIGWIPPRALQGGRARDDRLAQRDRSRLRHPAALHGRTVL
jgi:7,8-dihydropterin-6-yl-methyl-4-(beta-D-ribofuranosyl)aminobenzene 5'-phosphate synthase